MSGFPSRCNSKRQGKDTIFCCCRSPIGWISPWEEHDLWNTVLNSRREIKANGSAFLCVHVLRESNESLLTSLFTSMEMFHYSLRFKVHTKVSRAAHGAKSLRRGSLKPECGSRCWWIADPSARNERKRFKQNKPDIEKRVGVIIWTLKFSNSYLKRSDLGSCGVGFKIV